jgi:hypothetical protein
MTEKENNKIQLFENKKVRVHWDEDSEKWWFSVIDVIEVLTDSEKPRRYWSDLKRKLKLGGSEMYEKIVQLKMQAPDGKLRLTHKQWKSIRKLPNVAVVWQKPQDYNTKKNEENPQFPL